MSMEMANVSVKNNTQEQQYETSVNGALAILKYVIEDDAMIFTHTSVPQELEGHGIAAKLARTALDDARREGKAVVPLCPYVASYIQRHADYRDLVPAAYQGLVSRQE